LGFAAIIAGVQSDTQGAPTAHAPGSPTPPQGTDAVVSRARLWLLFALVGLVLWTDLVRYQDPIGEKHFALLEPGAADFSVIFDGTRVFMDGHNPYYFRDADSQDRWGRADVIGGRWFRVSYQPSHFLVYLPIALLTTNNREAGRLIFDVSMALYLLLAVVAWRLTLRVTSPPDHAQRLLVLLLPIFAVLLGTNIGTALSLARCQSDVINAALSWSAVLLFLGGRRFWPMFMLIAAASMKGYPVLLGVGLFLLGLRRGGWRAELAGVLAGLVFWLAPVLPYLHDGFIAALSHANGFFTPHWLNHSFRNLFFHLSPGLADPGRWAMVLLGLLVSAGCWRQAHLALRHEDARATAVWLPVFATSALMTMVGMSTLSYIYNQILLLPGVLVLLCTGDVLWRECGFQAPVRRVLFGLECVMGILMLKYFLAPLGFPLAALGNLVLVSLLAAAVAGRFVVSRRAERT
jgi:hypothetical protein